jgi:hypothetical protein
MTTLMLDMALAPRLRVAALVAFTLAAVPVSAGAATTTRPLTIASAVTRSDCAIKRLAGATGTTALPYTATLTGAVTFALRGGASSDWDLAVFKHDTQRRMAGSGAFGADETIQLLLRAGEQVDVQACRVAGSATLPLTISTQRLALAPLGGAPQSGSLAYVETGSLKRLRLLQTLGLNTNEGANARGMSTVVADAAQFKLLDRLGFSYRTLIPDLAAQDRRDRATDRAATASNLPSGRTEYRHLEDYQAELKQLVQDHPALVRAVTLPKKSFQGRPQTGVEISSDVNAADDQKPVSFIMGVHHAREWPAGEIPMEFAIYLAKSYGSDKEVTDLLNKTRVVIVPIINPDGFQASRDAPIDLADLTGDPAGAPSLLESVLPPGGSLGYRRKNCDGAIPLPSAPCELQYGVDPNRNYGFNWGGLGASSDVNSQTYRGSGPWSEPETQSVHEYSQVHDITTLLTMHNFASLVLRPPGTSGEGQAPDEVPLKSLGDAMGADTGYTSQYGYQLYDTSGTTEDWNYGAAGTFGYTIEMGPADTDGGNFHIAYQQGVIDQWNGTGTRAGRGLRQALLRLAGAASDDTQFATIAGRAPAGRVLRVKKTFKTSTSPVCAIADVLPLTLPDPLGAATSCIAPGPAQQIDDRLEYTTTVPANGVFSWLVTPSTRPFVHKMNKAEAWTLSCEDAAGTVFETKQVTIWRGEKQSFELPCGGTLPKPPAAVKDRLAPRSKITRKSLKATRAGVQLAGTSADFAPAGLAPNLANVSVTLGRRVGKQCRFARASGAFGPKVSCQRTSYLPATGTTTWTFLFRHRLPAGRYLAWIRAVDSAGNRERKAKSRNLVTFKLT